MYAKINFKVYAIFGCGDLNEHRSFSIWVTIFCTRWKGVEDRLDSSGTHVDTGPILDYRDLESSVERQKFRRRLPHLLWGPLIVSEAQLLQP